MRRAGLPGVALALALRLGSEGVAAWIRRIEAEAKGKGSYHCLANA